MTTVMSLLFVLGLSLLMFGLWLLWQIALSVPLGF